MSESNYTLGKFIVEEMHKRKMSMRDFASLMGVSHATISDYASDKQKSPQSAFLVKLADTTNTNLQAIFALAYPEVAERTALSPEAIIIAQRLDRLPDNTRDILIRLANS